MKLKLIYSALFLLSCFGVSAQLQSNMKVDIQIFEFQDPSATTFVELYTGILASTLNSDSEGAKQVEIVALIKSEDKIVWGDKYALTSRPNSSKDLFYIKRIALGAGDYNAEIILTDAADSSNRLSQIIPFKIEPYSDVAISSIQILDNIQKSSTDSEYDKNGFVMEPLKFKYFNADHEKLLIYSEVYNTTTLDDDYYLIKYDLIRDLGNEQKDTVLTRYKRRAVSSVDPILLQEKSDTLWPSGKYSIQISVLNYDQEILASENSNFVMSNPAYQESDEGSKYLFDNSFVQKLDASELNIALRALTPKVNPLDIERLNNLIRDGDIESQKSFLHRYWTYFSPIDPELGYNAYMEVVAALDNMYYDAMGRGFETDRGYYYLKYGRPDQMINVEDESTAPPYEIWAYADFPATRQNNVKFVFYNPAGTTYELLHTNARGELNDPQWLLKLYRNSPEDVLGNSIDATNVKDYWNRRAGQIYNDL